MSRIFLPVIFLVLWGTPPAHAAEIIRPKVLVVATYETGQDRGDVPGELQYWVERQKLDTTVSGPGLEHPLLTNGAGLYAMVSGTTSRCAVQMMALAMNPNIDLSHTYILLSGPTPRMHIHDVILDHGLPLPALDDNDPRYPPSAMPAHTTPR